jgi:putative DNA primase/helicase
MTTQFSYTDSALYLLKKAGITPEPGIIPFNDTGNADRLVAFHGDDLRYIPEWKKWLVFDGAKWNDNAIGEVMRRAKATVNELHLYAAEQSAKAAKEENETVKEQLAKQSEAFSKWARKSGGKRDLDAMVSLAQSDISVEIHHEELDRSKWLLNVINGTLDLRTGELREHERKDLITKMAGCEYDPNAKCPVWLDFLDKIMAGDQGVIAYLQRAVGWSLTGDVSEHVLFIMFGSGRNGKSTFINTVLSMMGEYGATIPSEVLLLRSGEEHPTASSILNGLRFAPMVETADGRKLNETAVKQYTGSDKIRTRRMREDYWEFWPTHHLWMATNHRPSIAGTDLGIWSRIRMIPFNVRIHTKERDPKLQDKLLAELPGILAWAVRGCLEWKEKGGLQEPDAIKIATRQYASDMDTLGDFLEERCVEEQGASVSAAIIYDDWKERWAPINGERNMSKRKFGLKLAERGFLSGKEGGNRVWFGIRMASDIERSEPKQTKKGLFDDEFSTGEVDAMDALEPNSGLTVHGTDSIGVNAEKAFNASNASKTETVEEIVESTKEMIRKANGPPDDDKPEIVDLEDF